MPVPDCVGALIRDDKHRVYVHRRSAARRLFPGLWDIVGGHLDPGETAEAALAREIVEETGWTLRHIDGRTSSWEWTPDERHTDDPAERRTRVEWDFLVRVDGDLSAPVLEAGKHDAYAWVGPEDLDLLMAGRPDDDRRLRDVVAKAVRTRFTNRLRLEPIGPDHVPDLLRLHTQPEIAEWFGEPWTETHAATVANHKANAWETEGVSKWVAYDRVNGELVGRGGVDRLPRGGAVTRGIADLLGPDWAADPLEVGWTVSADKQRHGFATEVGRAGLDYSFNELGAARVAAYTEVHNKASRAVMERLGMSYAGEISGPDLVPTGSSTREFAPFAVYELSR